MTRPRREPIPLDPTTAAVVVDAAIAWFAEHGRDLPWRRTRDPWAVLVSEVMLQQLRVARTTPFYERFIARFPTPGALAEATLGEALKVWGDLGRYRAAAALHRAAGILVGEHGGAVPSEVGALLALPGVGAYTAGAVACFAHERDVAFLDTNARRVLHRVFVGVDVPRPTAGAASLRDLSERLVPAGRAWAWNQALIEVGALRCTARSVECGRCPMARWCVARAEMASALKAKRTVGEEPAAEGVHRRYDLADAETVVKPERRYEGTNRQFRGQVLRALREAEDVVVSIEAIGRRVRPGFGEADRPWIEGVVASLERDGLVRRAPVPPVGRGIGEERAGYDAGDGAVVERGEEGIALP